MSDKTVIHPSKQTGSPARQKVENKVRFVLKPREKKREFVLNDDDYFTLADLIHSQTGIVLKDHKKDMVYGRLSKRLRQFGMTSFGDYLHYLAGDNGPGEIGMLINAITTNLTRFFREPHHFDHLRDHVLPEILDLIKQGRQSRLRLWSAGCSSGEEPYSMAMCLDEALNKRPDQILDAKILATDLDTNMLERGRAGRYRDQHLEHLPPEFQPYLSPAQGEDGYVQAQDILRHYISFKQLNLLEKWPFSGPFDAIFCRNVMIYFDAGDKQRLISRLVEKLRPGGWLFIGHSETILDMSPGLKLYGRTIYQKTQLDHGL